MHKHQWTLWKYTGQPCDYYTDGYYVKTKYWHESYCTVCGKVRARKFRNIYKVVD